MYISFIILWWRMILPFLADLIASKTDQMVNKDKKWIGLKGPMIFKVWIQKLLTHTHNIKLTQTYPRDLWNLVPFGLTNWKPPTRTAANAAYACDGIGWFAVLRIVRSKQTFLRQVFVNIILHKKRGLETLTLWNNYILLNKALSLGELVSVFTLIISISWVVHYFMSMFCQRLKVFDLW